MQADKGENRVMETMRSFDRIIGYEAIKEELMRLCDTLKNTEKYRRMGAVSPRGLMIYGLPGLGKTEMAKCVLTESGRKSFIIRRDRADSEFIDRIREVFKEAREAAPSIVLLDDLDKFVDEGSTKEYSSVQACMDDCRDYDVFVIATANFADNIPFSLLRAGRLEKQIEVYYPKEADAVKIVEYYLKDKEIADDIEPEEIARLISGSSCAQLEIILNEAAVYAGYSGRACANRQDILRACIRYRCGSPMVCFCEDTPALEMVAIHEAGHAVVAEILKPESVNYAYACINARGKSGQVYYRSCKEEKTWEDRENDLIIGLASKAATEVVKGVVDTGCNHDLQDAFTIAEELVDNYCSFGFTTFKRNSSSSYLISEKEHVVSSEVSRCYLRAKKILTDNRRLLDAVISALKAKNIITYKEIAEIKRNTGVA